MARYRHEVKEYNFIDAVSDAFGEFQCLAEEMGDWRDSMEEKLSHTSKYEIISDCTDTLEQNMDEIDCPKVVEDLLADTQISVGMMVLNRKKSRSGPSRQTRFDNAVSTLSAAVDELSAIIDNNEDAADVDKLAQDLIDEVESYRDELQMVVDNLEGACEFPGMYG